LRFIFAIVSFVLAFVLIGYGIAQRTIFAAPDFVTASATMHSNAPVTIINASTMMARAGHQTVTISGASTVFAAYGRTSDVRAWVGDANYNQIGVNSAKTALTSKEVTGKANTVPDPKGSDLWLGEFSGKSGLSFTVNVPAGISLVVTSTGAKPAPTDISIRWPVDNRTPWSGPLIIGGVLLLLAGLGMYLWALVHLRRARGPRRKTPKTPKMPRVPKQRGYQRPNTKAVEVKSGRRRSTTRRMTAIVPLVLVGMVALSGCSAAQWPTFLGGGGTPTPTSTIAPGAVTKLKPPVVTDSQVKAIIANVSAVAAAADKAKDATLLATRFEGPALELRSANYAIGKADSTYATPAAIPAGTVEIALPQQSVTWPRTVFAVVQNPKDKTIAPMALMLIQATPRSNYKVDYAMSLQPKVQVPKVAAVDVGAPRLFPTSKLLLLSPDQLATAYGDILNTGPASQYNKYFDTASDNLVKAVGLDSKNARKKALPAYASMTFSNAAGSGQTIVFGTNDSGAIVAVDLNETETVTPTQAGASITPSGATKTLSAITATAKGIVSVHGDQLLFYVPKLGSTQKVVLLGYAEGLISAKEKQ
jgi:hypothetical protein